MHKLELINALSEAGWQIRSMEPLKVSHSDKGPEMPIVLDVEHRWAIGLVKLWIQATDDYKKLQELLRNAQAAAKAEL